MDEVENMDYYNYALMISQFFNRANYKSGAAPFEPLTPQDKRKKLEREWETIKDRL